MRPMTEPVVLAFWEEVEKIANSSSFDEYFTPPVSTEPTRHEAVPPKYYASVPAGMQADPYASRKRWLRRLVVGSAAAGTGLALGGGATLALSPAILKALGAKPSPGVVGIASALAGLSSAALLGGIGAYASAPPSRTTRSLRSTGAVQPPYGQLAQRHQGHSSSVSPRHLSSDASGGRVLPLSTGAGSRVNGLGEYRDNHYRLRGSQYRFRGETPSDYSVKRPVRMGEHKS